MGISQRTLPTVYRTIWGVDLDPAPTWLRQEENTYYVHLGMYAPNSNSANILHVGIFKEQKVNNRNK